MIELQHQDEPVVLEKYRQQHPQANWETAGFQPVKEETRHALHIEQDGLCVYCEQKICLDEGHVEHIKPKGKYPAQRFVYNNLAHSCNGQKHCGHNKGGHEIAIEPRQDCNRYFELRERDGILEPAADLNEDEEQQARETLRIIGLNNAKLSNKREQFAAVIRYLANPQEVTEFLQTAPFRWSLQGL